MSILTESQLRRQQPQALRRRFPLVSGTALPLSIPLNLSSKLQECLALQERNAKNNGHFFLPAIMCYEMLPMPLTLFMLAAGLLVLTLGAEVLVRNACALAAAARISPLVIGLTVVAYGTSTPELVVSLQSTFRGQADIALGNVLGSNIFNVLFILGISAVIIPLRVSQQLLRFDVPLMILLSILLALMAIDGRIGRLDGLLLTLGILSYTTWAIVQSRKESAEVSAEYAAEYGSEAATSEPRRLALKIAGVLVGLTLLVLGSRWFTEAAVALARHLGFSELVIGLTIVAAGTSMPEVATSIVAAMRGERDIAVGNVVGSNLFNIMGVLGLSGLLSSTGVQVATTALYLDIPVMIAVSISCLPIFFTAHLIARWEGAVFLLYFLAYTSYLILAETNPALTRSFAGIMLGFVLPLTILALTVSLVRALKEQAVVEGPSRN